MPDFPPLRNATAAVARLAATIVGNSSRPPRGVAPDAGVPRVARACEAVLDRARQFASAGTPDARVALLVARACELLDDLDDRLVALHPVRDAAAFALAAQLYRELAWIEASIPREHRRLARMRSRRPPNAVDAAPRAMGRIETGAPGQVGAATHRTIAARGAP